MYAKYNYIWQNYCLIDYNPYPIISQSSKVRPPIGILNSEKVTLFEWSVILTQCMENAPHVVIQLEEWDCGLGDKMLLDAEEGDQSAM